MTERNQEVDPLEKKYPCFVCRTPEDKARGGEGISEAFGWVKCDHYRPCGFCPDSSGELTGERIAGYHLQGGGYPSDEYEEWIRIYGPAIDEARRLQDVVRLSNKLKRLESDIFIKLREADRVRDKLKELKRK